MHLKKYNSIRNYAYYIRNRLIRIGVIVVDVDFCNRRVVDVVFSRDVYRYPPDSSQIVKT